MSIFLKNPACKLKQHLYNKALVITPIGKLFHYISNMIYLSLVRFKIDFVYLKYVVSLHQLGRIKILFVWPLNSPKVANVSVTSFVQLPVLLALCWSLCCCYWCGSRWANHHFHFCVEEFLLLYIRFEACSHKLPITVPYVQTCGTVRYGLIQILKWLQTCRLILDPVYR